VKTRADDLAAEPGRAHEQIRELKAKLALAEGERDKAAQHCGRMADLAWQGGADDAATRTAQEAPDAYGRSRYAEAIRALTERCEALSTTATAAQQRADDAERVATDLRDDLDRLRAIVEGRTTPPTDAESAAHDAAGGAWLVAWRRGERPTVASIVSGPRVWWPTADVVTAVALDAQRRPCAWPVVTEAPRG